MSVWEPVYYKEARAEVERLEHEYYAAIDEWEDEPQIGRAKIERVWEELQDADEHKSVMWDVFQTHLAIKLKLSENATIEPVTLSTCNAENQFTAILADCVRSGK